jgi:beta-glucanase (GH16 family)
MYIRKLLLACLAVYACFAAQAQENTKKWKLVWTEDFKGTKLDTTRWNYEVNDQGGGNNELQYYTARDTNVYVKGGLLHIRGLKEDYLTRHYTSARITTRHKADFTFGKMEIRAKIPTGRGMWPAIWMMPTDDKYGGWPLSGEIDIMETKGQHPDTLYGTMHFGQKPPNNKYKGTVTTHEAPGGYGDGFHVYGIEWKKDTIAWFVDGRQFFETNSSMVTTAAYPFNERFHFILNLAIGGEFVGNPDDSILPKEFLVDYIKVWEPK